MRSRRVTVGVAAVALGLAAASPAFAQGLSVRIATALRTARAPAAQLRTIADQRSHGAVFIRVRQRVRGIPVLGSVSTLSLSSSGAALLLDHTRARMARPPRARVAKSAAVVAARRVVRVRKLLASPTASLAILPNVSGGRLVWRVTLPATRPLGDFDVLVDARTGRVVQVRNRLEFADKAARVFDPNPIVEQGSRSGLADDGNKDSAALDALLRPATLQDLAPAGCLTGAWVAVDVNGSCPASFASITRSSPLFDAVMAYFHIDRMQRYIQSLGFSNIVNRPITVHPHATTEDNSFYRGEDGSLNFGTGGVDDAQDADVMDHEYGHAIQDSEVHGFGRTDESESIGEGFGDYWQASISARQGNPDKFNVCFAEWDTTAVSDDPIPCLRRVDLQWTLSQAYDNCIGREIHCVGQAWSNALWMIRSAFGGPTADRLILQSQFSYATDSGFADASLALLFADRQLYGGAHLAFLRNLLMGRGFLTSEQFDNQPVGARPLAVSGSASGRLDESSDLRDVYTVPLAAHHGVVFRLRATAGSRFFLAVYPPSTTTIVPREWIAGPTEAGARRDLAFVPAATGTYYLDVETDSGGGRYTVQALADTDRDSRPNVSDNCPLVPNRSQADWNRNRRGDACDRSSKTTVDGVSLRGRLLVVRGTVRPASIEAAQWLVQVRRGSRLLASAKGSSHTRSGRVVARLRLPPSATGRLTIRAFLRAPHYNRAASRPVSLSAG